MGYKREGNVAVLSTLGAELGFSVSVVDLLSDGGDAVHSTSIRKALVDGNVKDVAKKLGAEFLDKRHCGNGRQEGQDAGVPYR